MVSRAAKAACLLLVQTARGVVLEEYASRVVRHHICEPRGAWVRNLDNKAALLLARWSPCCAELSCAVLCRAEPL